MALQTLDHALRRLTALAALIGLFPLLSWGQANLVPNPSFEEANPCPGFSGQPGWTSDWFIPNLSFNTPDFYSVCSSSSTFSVPENHSGFQSAYGGDSYTGLYCFSFIQPEGREAISVELKSVLQSDLKYVFQMHYTLADHMDYSVQTLGYLLSANPLNDSTAIIEYLPTSYNTQLNYSDTMDWRLFSDTLTATGNERYLTIANFMSDALSDTNYLGQPSPLWNNRSAYYYIDDVSLIPLDSLMSVAQTEKTERPISVYPNPSNDKITLKSKKSLETVWLSDVSGRRLWALERRSSVQWETDLAGLPNGIYLVEAITKDGRSAVRKVVKL